MFIDGIVLDALRAGLSDLPASSVGTLERADALAHLPFVVARSISATTIDARFADRHTVQVDAYAATATAAHDLAMRARAALYSAYAAQADFPHGHLSWFDVVTAPVELREADQPSGLSRFTGTYTVIVHI